MRGRSIVEVVVSVMACAVILTGAVLWNEMPGSVVDCSDSEPNALNSDGSVKPYGIAHCVRTVSIGEHIAKITVSILAFVAIAFVVNRNASRAKWQVSASLSAVSALIALAVLGYMYGRIFERWLFPGPAMLLAICAGTGLAGAIASLALSRWWPNNSFERTREG